MKKPKNDQRLTPSMQANYWILGCKPVKLEWINLIL